MPSRRELYFHYLNLNNKYLNKNIIISIFCETEKISETELFLNFDDSIRNEEKISSMMGRIIKGEPYQYVLGYSFFLGQKYFVDKNVLIPRQESEQLVLELVKLAQKRYKNLKTIRICDICTGSGVLALSLRKYFHEAEIFATDISKEALEVAQKNNDIYNGQISILQGDMWRPLVKYQPFDVLICNPPYISNVLTIDEQVIKYEPSLALLALPNTKYYEDIFANVDRFLSNEAILGFEISEDMKDSLTILINKYFQNDAYIFMKDLYNKDRFLFIIRNGTKMISDKCLDNQLKEATQKLLNHGVVAFPTETVMGLGVIFDDEIAYQKLNIIKCRPEDKPYTLMLGTIEEIGNYAYLNKDIEKVIKTFLPGPLTLLLRTKDSVPSWVTHGGDIIGVRVSSNKTVLKLLSYVKKPLLVPSANKSGQKPAMTSIETKEIFKDKLDYIVDGSAEGGVPSTILDMTTDNYIIIRKGPITLEMIDKVIKGE